MLEKKSKVLFIFIVLLIILSIVFLYWKTLVVKDFVIENDVTEETI